jgi:hypothetical protein
MSENVAASAGLGETEQIRSRKLGAKLSPLWGLRSRERAGDCRDHLARALGIRVIVLLLVFLRSFCRAACGVPTTAKASTGD